MRVAGSPSRPAATGLRRMFDCRRRAIVAFVSLLWATSMSGCGGIASGRDTDADFPIIVGASRGSDIAPCADYAARWNYSGAPYHIRVPETGKITVRHKGMDFCTGTGSEVIAAAEGTIVNIVHDNPYRGGRVTIRTSIQYQHHNSGTSFLFLDALHLTPKQDLRIGDRVKAGQTVGYTQAPGKQEIGPRSHVHFSAGPVAETWETHTDPNRFWHKGPGVVSCFNPKTPPSEAQVVAPIRC